MKSHRIIIFIGILVAAALVLPGSVLASSLLSGYGGPGEGNQAILGSALVNGPKGGGGAGGSGGSSGSGSSSAASSSGGAGTTTGSATPSSAGASGARAPGGKGSSASGAGGQNQATGTAGHSATATATPAGQASFYPAAERIPSGSQDGTLGLSGADFLYIVLAVGVLVSLGVLTRRMGDGAQREGHGS